MRSRVRGGPSQTTRKFFSGSPPRRCRRNWEMGAPPLNFDDNVQDSRIILLLNSEVTHDNTAAQVFRVLCLPYAKNPKNLGLGVVMGNPSLSEQNYSASLHEKRRRQEFPPKTNPHEYAEIERWGPHLSISMTTSRGRH